MKLQLVRQIFPPKPPWIQHLHTSSMGGFAIPNEVLSIIETVNPIEPALDPLVPFLTPGIVTSVIENPPNPLLGFRFFIWASKYKRFRSWVSHAIILHLLIRENGHELYWQVLKEIKKCNISISADAFTLLIQAYAKMGMVEKAVEAFEMMRDFDSKPDVFTFNTILHVMVRREIFMLALGIYNRMLKLNCLPNRATFGILIDGMFKDGRIEDALRLFDEMTQRGIFPDGITYTIIISGLCHAQRIDAAYRLLDTMKDSGYAPDSATYNALLDGFCKGGRVDEALALLKLFEKDGYVLDKRGYSCLIDGLFRATRYEDAQVWYRKMIEDNIKPDVIFYTIMMKGLSNAGWFDDALKLLNEITEMGVVPDTICYNALMKSLCDNGLLDNAKSLSLEISQHEGFPNTCTYTILICGMCRNGLVGEAEQIFDEMEKLGCYPSVVTFNALIDGLCKAGNLEKAQLLFHKMEIGRNPSLFLRLTQGANRLLTTANLQNMVEQLCASGLILKAYNIITQLANSGSSPDIITYNILINGFCKAGNINGAFKLFQELQLKGLSPDSVTYGTLINGLLRSKRDEDAFRLFDQMFKNGCTPLEAVYKCLMTWSCRRKEVTSSFSLWLRYLQSIPSRDEKALMPLGEYFEKGEVEMAIRGLLEMDFKLNDFRLAPYTIWLIGLCQAGRLEEALKLFFILDECKVIVPPPSCVKLIYRLHKERNLELATEIFIYTIEKGYRLNRRVCNRLLATLLCCKDKRSLAFDLLGRMKSLGYNLNVHIYQYTKFEISPKFGFRRASSMRIDEADSTKAEIQS